jgi:hypothetical protein
MVQGSPGGAPHFWLQAKAESLWGWLARRSRTMLAVLGSIHFAS